MCGRMRWVLQLAPRGPREEVDRDLRLSPCKKHAAGPPHHLFSFSTPHARRRRRRPGECFRRVNSGGECGAPRGKGAGIHGIRGASGGVPARGPGSSQISAPRARPSPPVFTLRKHSTGGQELPSTSHPGGTSRVKGGGGARSERPVPENPASRRPHPQTNLQPVEATPARPGRRGAVRHR